MAGLETPRKYLVVLRNEEEALITGEDNCCQPELIFVVR
jgi:hypothetical protein